MTKSKIKSVVELPPLLIAICAFCLLHPYFLWRTPNVVQFGLFPVMYLFAIIPNMDLKQGNMLLFSSFAALILFVILLAGYNIAYALALLSLAVVPFAKSDVLDKAITIFEIILAVFFLGGIMFFFARVFGLPIQGQIIEPLNEVKEYNCTLYAPFLVINNKLTDFFRFCGPFDEPGVVGTVATLVLYIEKYNLKKWYVSIIFVAAILSFSFFFVVGSLIWLAFKVAKKFSNAIFIVIVMLLFYGVTKDIPVMDELVYSRMEMDDETGMISGDDRASDALIAYVNSIRGTSEYFFGSRGDTTTSDFLGCSGYRMAILRYGFIFCFFYILWFYAFSRQKKLSFLSGLIFMIILVGNFYQRPNPLHFTYIFLNTALITRWRLEELKRMRVISSQEINKNKSYVNTALPSRINTNPNI